MARGEQSSRQDTVWSADSTYALVYENRARAPNLAAIRELSFAVYNGRDDVDQLLTNLGGECGELSSSQHNYNLVIVIK